MGTVGTQKFYMNEFVQKELLQGALKLTVPDTKDLFFQGTPNVSIQYASFHQKEIWGLVILSLFLSKFSSQERYQGLIKQQ